MSFRLAFYGYTKVLPAAPFDRDFARLRLAAGARRLNQERAADPYRTLAVAVIDRALHDLHARIPLDRNDAIEFFAGTRIEFWASLTSRSAREWREVADTIRGAGYPRTAALWKYPTAYKRAGRKGGRR